MTRCNKNLTEERWFKLSFFEQMANLGSEVERAIKWRKEELERSKLAFESALELLDLTIDDQKNRARPKLIELLRLREVLVDYFCYDNIYGSTDQNMSNYFYAFNYAVAINR